MVTVYKINQLIINGLLFIVIYSYIRRTVLYYISIFRYIYINNLINAMNTNFEVSVNTTVEWYTPPEIIQPLGEFDLDPCTSDIAYSLNKSAKKYYTKEDDGLCKEWYGRVWLNPPYSQPTIAKFMEKMALHNNGIALLYNRTDNQMFQSIVLPIADSIFFLSGRIKFLRPDGTKGKQPGVGSVLVAFGEKNTKAITESGLKGHMFKSVNKKVSLQTSLTF